MLFVVLAFCVPKIRVIAGSYVSTIVPVPKATVNKNNDTLLGENKIRFSDQRTGSAPSGYMKLFKNLYHFHFGCFCITAFYGFHNSRSLFFDLSTEYDSCSYVNLADQLLGGISYEGLLSVKDTINEEANGGEYVNTGGID